MPSKYWTQLCGGSCSAARINDERKINWKRLKHLICRLISLLVVSPTCLFFHCGFLVCAWRASLGKKIATAVLRASSSILVKILSVGETCGTIHRTANSGALPEPPTPIAPMALSEVIPSGCCPLWKTTKGLWACLLKYRHGGLGVWFNTFYCMGRLLSWIIIWSFLSVLTHGPVHIDMSRAS